MPSLAKAIGIFAALVAAASLIFIWSRDSDALWKIVHDRCVPGQSSRNDPAPCTEVDLDERWALYKDDHGATQYLLMPTDRVTGIEDPFILSQAPNYWLAAWIARRFVSQRAGKSLRDDEIALAINSQLARSQNQLHIHVDCIRPDVRDALHRIQAQISASWMPTTVLGQEYDVRSITEDDLRRNNAFALVADHLQPGQTMAAETIVLTGAALADGTSGFDLLAGRLGVGRNRGGGELLEDHSCAIAKAP